MESDIAARTGVQQGGPSPPGDGSSDVTACAGMREMRERKMGCTFEASVSTSPVSAGLTTDGDRPSELSRLRRRIGVDLALRKARNNVTAAVDGARRCVRKPQSERSRKFSLLRFAGAACGVVGP
ncbi:hypothetical protein PsYK624_161360 [Phanerochaete sordida]|uniref:Uncharacterized protein n=1 Tax=Phanerochaete sordida TaxID=48140 RepID=A0A9P3GQX1_9APHY|nr:hypothetical protein PsYK624_161360 [Phanerochaete sordida]